MPLGCIFRSGWDERWRATAQSSALAIVGPMVVLDLLAIGFGADSRDGPGDDVRRPIVP